MTQPGDGSELMKKKTWLQTSLEHSIPNYKQFEDMNKLRVMNQMAPLTLEEFRLNKLSIKPKRRLK